MKKASHPFGDSSGHEGPPLQKFHSPLALSRGGRIVSRPIGTHTTNGALHSGESLIANNNYLLISPFIMCIRILLHIFYLLIRPIFFPEKRTGAPDHV